MKEGKDSIVREGLGIEKIEKLMLGMDKLQGKEINVVVNIGGISFGGEEDLLVWIVKEFPPSFPFGCFVDVYSF